MDGLGDEERNLLLRDLIVSRYINVATFALLIYEYSLTVSDETRLVWKARLSFPKVLFFVNRYLAFAVAFLSSYFLLFNTRYNACRTAWFATGVISFSGYMVVECILFTRAYAIWGRHRPLALFLTAVFIASIAGTLVGSRYINHIDTVQTRYFETGCILRFSNRIAWRALVILAICEILAIVLLVFKALRHFQYSRGGLMRMLLEDGLFYFVAVMATTLIHLIVLQLTRPALCNYLLLTQGVLQSALCSRMLLRIRGAFEDSQENQGGLALDHNSWEASAGHCNINSPPSGSGSSSESGSYEMNNLTTRSRPAVSGV